MQYLNVSRLPQFACMDLDEEDADALDDGLLAIHDAHHDAIHAAESALYATLDPRQRALLEHAAMARQRQAHDLIVAAFVLGRRADTCGQRILEHAHAIEAAAGIVAGGGRSSECRSSIHGAVKHRCS